MAVLPGTWHIANVSEMATSAAVIIIVILGFLSYNVPLLTISNKDLGMVYSRRIKSDKEKERRVSPQNLKYVKEHLGGSEG